MRRKNDNPERKIQDSIIGFLKLRDWFVIETHGNIYQMGLPDLYACHLRYGYRWIEVKNPKNYRFTPAQMEIFPQMTGKGIGIWIMVAATEAEYNKLFRPANWHTYLKW